VNIQKIVKMITVYWPRLCNCSNCEKTINMLNKKNKQTL